MPWWQIFFLIVSNFLFILPGVRALQLQRHAQSFIYFSIVIFSSLYHLCKAGWVDEPGEGGICVLFSFAQYHALDFFFAQMTLPLTVLYLINFNPTIAQDGHVLRGDLRWLEESLLYSYGVVIATSLMLLDPGKESFLALIGSLFSVLVLFWSYNYFFYRDVPTFDKKDIGIALFLGGLAIALISSQSAIPGRWYWLTHSVWHALGAVGQFYLMEARNQIHVAQTRKSGEDTRESDLAPHRPDGAESWGIPAVSLWSFFNWALTPT